MVQYFVTDNPLTERKDDCAAHIKAGRTYDLEALIERMLQKGSTITKTDCLAVVNNITETIQQIIKEGDTINIPLFNTSFSISGVFEGATDTFDPKRHKLNLNMHKGTALTQALAATSVEKVTAVIASQTLVVEVRDSTSGTVNETLTPNGIIEIVGNSIKIEGDNPAVGLFFINQADGTVTKSAVIADNKPSRLLAQIPALSAGSYTIRIVTQHSGSILLKEPRVCDYAKILVVA